MNLYVVRSQDGRFFRAKGLGGGGQTWVDSLDRAKFYPKVGQAKARVTFFAKAYPEFGVPDILEFTLDVSQAKVLDMTEQTKKSLNKIERRKLGCDEWNDQNELKRLRADQDRINRRIKELKG